MTKCLHDIHVFMYVYQVGSVFGFILLIILGILQAQLFPEVFDLPWSVWGCAIMMPMLMFCVGFGLAAAFCMRVRQCRTIAYETGLQNAGIVLTAIAISYPPDVGAHYAQYPLLYSAWMIVEGTGIALFHVIHFCRVEKRTACQQCKEGIHVVTEEEEDQIVLRLTKPKSGEKPPGTAAPDGQYSTAYIIDVDVDDSGALNQISIISKDGGAGVANGSAVHEEMNGFARTISVDTVGSGDNVIPPAYSDVTSEDGEVIPTPSLHMGEGPSSGDSGTHM